MIGLIGLLAGAGMGLPNCRDVRLASDPNAGPRPCGATVDGRRLPGLRRVVREFVHPGPPPAAGGRTARRMRPARVCSHVARTTTTLTLSAAPTLVRPVDQPPGRRLGGRGLFQDLLNVRRPQAAGQAVGADDHPIAGRTRRRGQFRARTSARPPIACRSSFRAGRRLFGGEPTATQLNQAART